MDREFDYVIVGAGSAGCVLANKLSEDDNNSIIITNLKYNDYRDNKGDLVSFTKIIKNKNFVYEDRYDKFLNYFE